MRWTANAIVGLVVGSAVLGVGIRWGRAIDAQEVRDIDGARVIAEASADSLVDYLRRGRCFAGPITHDSLTALRLEAHFDDSARAHHR